MSLWLTRIYTNCQTIQKLIAESLQFQSLLHEKYFLLFAGLGAGESICDGFCKNPLNYGRFFYPYGIKSRTLRRYPIRFGPVSFRSGHFGQLFGRFGLDRWVVSA